MHGLRVGAGTRQFAALPVGEGVDSPYPFALILPQSRTERLLAERLAELGVTVERQAELTGFTQDGAGVDATIHHADGGTEIIRADYLAGCDGARRIVRHTLGIPFEGETETADFVLCDALMQGALDPASIYLWWHDGGSVALFPVRETLWRVFAKRPGHSEATPTIEEMRQLLARRGPPASRSGNPSGSRISASTNAWRGIFAKHAASCSATPPMCTARRAARA